MELMKNTIFRIIVPLSIIFQQVYGIFFHISWEAGIIFLVKSWNNLETIKLEAAIGKIWKSAKKVNFYN